MSLIQSEPRPFNGIQYTYKPGSPLQLGEAALRSQAERFEADVRAVEQQFRARDNGPTDLQPAADRVQLSNQTLDGGDVVSGLYSKSSLQVVFRTGVDGAVAGELQRDGNTTQWKQFAGRDCPETASLVRRADGTRVFTVQSVAF